MKRIFGFSTFVIIAFLFAGFLAAQDNPARSIESRDKKLEQRKKADQARISRVNDLVKENDFVLEPNQLGGFNVNPVTNFVMVAGDLLVFQTSSPVDRTRANIPFTDKTVMGRITSKDIRINSKGYHLIRYGLMTEVGVGFRVDMRISPTGNATASVTKNNGAGRLDYNGPIVPREQATVSVGAESIDLTGFPWYFDFIHLAHYGW
jgi:hypothetical protein